MRKKKMRWAVLAAALLAANTFRVPAWAEPRPFPPEEMMEMGHFDDGTQEGTAAQTSAEGEAAAPSPELSADSEPGEAEAAGQPQTAPSVSPVLTPAPVPVGAEPETAVEPETSVEGTSQTSTEPVKEDVLTVENGKVMINVPYIDQSTAWPTGCESVSAVMLLQFLGIGIDVDAFIENYLETRPMEYRGNLIFGPDPRVAFAGDPYDPDSYGCYAPVIRNAMEKALNAADPAITGPEGKKLEVLDLTGVPMEELLSDYIDQGMPVVFWATIDLVESFRGPVWTVDETGAKFIWTSREHCMLLVGYDDRNYYFNDPWKNYGLIGYERSLVEQRHKELFYMAVGVREIS